MSTHQAALMEKLMAALYEPQTVEEAAQAAFAIFEAELTPRPIETAPKDGSRIILVKIGRPTDPATWKELPPSVWWCVTGSWSAKWNKWWDNVEPCGLASPTHWMPVPEPREGK